MRIEIDKYIIVSDPQCMLIEEQSQRNLRAKLEGLDFMQTRRTK